MKPKKQTVTFENKYHNVNDAGKGISVRRAVIDGESFYSATDFLKYLLLLDHFNQRLTKGYIANELRLLSLDSKDFWNKIENIELFDVVIEHLDNYGDWIKCRILIQFFLSKLVRDELKINYISKAETMPTATYQFVSTSTEIASTVRSKMLSKFKADEAMILEIITTEEDKDVLNAALYNLNIAKIYSQNVINIYIQEKRLDSRKRVELIKKSTNLDVLNNLIFTDNDFDVVKAARTRVKELPNTLKFINDLQESEAA